MATTGEDSDYAWEGEESHRAVLRDDLNSFRVFPDVPQHVDTDQVHIPKWVNVYLFGPQGAGKSSFIRTCFRALNGPSCANPDHARIEKEVTRDARLHDGTTKYGIFQLTKSIRLHDTRGQQNFSRREEAQLKLVLDGLAQPGKEITQRERYWYLFGEFWKSEDDMAKRFSGSVSKQFSHFEDVPHFAFITLNTREQQLVADETDTTARDVYRRAVRILREREIPFAFLCTNGDRLDEKDMRVVSQLPKLLGAREPLYSEERAGLDFDETAAVGRVPPIFDPDAPITATLQGVEETDTKVAVQTLECLRVRGETEETPEEKESRLRAAGVVDYSIDALPRHMELLHRRRERVEQKDSKHAERCTNHRSGPVVRDSGAPVSPVRGDVDGTDPGEGEEASEGVAGGAAGLGCGPAGELLEDAWGNKRVHRRGLQGDVGHIRSRSTATATVGDEEQAAGTGAGQAPDGAMDASGTGACSAGTGGGKRRPRWVVWPHPDPLVRVVTNYTDVREEGEGEDEDEDEEEDENEEGRERGEGELEEDLEIDSHALSILYASVEEAERGIREKILRLIDDRKNREKESVPWIGQVPPVEVCKNCRRTGRSPCVLM